ncbi:hypothetical protein [Bifidobacterium aquikefiri]
MRLFSYVVRYDFGFAPNPFHGWCTLADCKPLIREFAEPGDWIMGTSSVGNRRGITGRLVYAMQVDETLTFDDYWHDPRFVSKHPNLRGSRMLQFGDNIYHRDSAGAWIQDDSHHSRDDGSPEIRNIEHDTRIDRVLVGRRFVYFGEKGPKIPKELSDGYPLGLVHSGPGHRYQFEEKQTADAIDWLESLGSGVQDRPRDWT